MTGDGCVKAMGQTANNQIGTKMSKDRHQDAPADCTSRFDCGNYEVGTDTRTDAEIWEQTPPKFRRMLGPDFADRFGTKEPE